MPETQTDASAVKHTAALMHAHQAWAADSNPIWEVCQRPCKASCIPERSHRTPGRHGHSVRPMATHQNTGLYGPGDADGEDNSQKSAVIPACDAGRSDPGQGREQDARKNNGWVRLNKKQGAEQELPEGQCGAVRAAAARERQASSSGLSGHKEAMPS